MKAKIQNKQRWLISKPNSTRGKIQTPRFQNQLRLATIQLRKKLRRRRCLLWRKTHLRKSVSSTIWTLSQLKTWGKNNLLISAHLWRKKTLMFQDSTLYQCLSTKDVPEIKGLKINLLRSQRWKHLSHLKIKLKHV